MDISTDEWTTSAEAARLIGVTPSRVIQMGDEDGLLDIIRPWPHVALIGRQSLAAWVAGARQPKIGTPYAKRWLLKRCEVRRLDAIDVNDMRDRLRDFIEEARPRWDNRRKDLWALQMASQLHRAATNAA